MNYCLDTNIIIYLQNGQLKNPLPKGKYLISVISEIELLSYHALTERNRQKVHELMRLLFISPLSNQVKETAIQLRRDHRLKTPDAIITATATVADAVLLTNDRKLLAIPNLKAESVSLVGE